MDKMRNLLLLLLMLTVQTRMMAQFFKTFNMSDGLTNNTVKSIVQDNDGFLWAGTFDGLSRYDGLSFRSYFHSASGCSLSDNHIEALCRMDSLLLIGTSRGIDIFDCLRGSLTHAFFPDGPSDMAVRQFASVGDRLYAIDNDGVVFYSTDCRTFRPLEQLAPLCVQAIARCDQRLMAISTNKEILLLDVTDNSIVNRLEVKARGMSGNNHVLYYSHVSHKLYLGLGIGGEGIAIKIGENDELAIDTEQVPSNLKCVTDWGNRVVFGTDGTGLVVKRGGEVRTYLPANSNISSDAIHSLFADAGGNLWIGTYRGGLNVLSGQYNWFTQLTLANRGIAYPIVSSVYRRGSLIYAATDGGGLNIHDLRNGRLIRLTSANSGLPGDHVLALAADEQRLWMGVYGKGLCYYDFVTERISSYSSSEECLTRIWQMAHDGSGHLWIVGDGVGILHKESATFMPLAAFRKKHINCIQHKDSIVWLAADDGIYKVDASTYGILRHYTHLPNARAIKTLYVDGENRIWFAPENGGLCAFRESGDSIERMTVMQGIDCRNVVSLCADESRKLWVATENGLYCKALGADFFTAFGRADNLRLTHFCYNSLWNDGHNIVLGATEGMMLFTPSLMKPQPSPSGICFDDIFLLKNNRTITLSRKSPRRISLAHNDNFFRIHFSVPRVVGSSHQQVRYRLHGFEDHWTLAAREWSAYYTNVPPGDYTFEVSATDASGQYSTTSSFDIRIRQPWWSTWPALLLWLAVIVASILGIVGFYLHEQKNKALIKQKENEQRILKKADEDKMNFFAGITHELRTPVFLVTAPLEELLDKGENPVKVPHTYLKHIYNNALRLNKLISQILDIRKLDLDHFQPQCQQIELVSHFTRLSRNYRVLCRQKRLRFSFLHSSAEITASIDVAKVELIVSNLISNAYKYTPQGGEVSLSISETSEYVRFDVKDTGVGIAEAEKGRIFDRYYRANNATATVGDGIGLAFVKKLVEVLGGSIGVESEVGVGSDFFFVVPRQVEQPLNQTLFKSELTDCSKVEDSFLSMPSPVATQRILVVDDERETLDLISHTLERDYQVLTADSGEKGLEAAREQLPDLIICDLMMPGMNGFELLEKVKGDSKLAHIPVIMLSARGLEEDELNAFKQGADAYITKPVSISYLKKRLKALLDARQKHEDMSSPIVERHYSKEDKMFILRCKEVIDENLKNENLGVDLLAERLDMSHSALYKRLKSVTGKSAVEFINDYRIFIAQKLISAGERNVSKIAEDCGFNDVRSFRAAFKARMQMTPKQYMQQL